MAIELLRFWYSSGFRDFLQFLKTKLSETEDLFGIGNLFATLFLPFRQISANETGTSLDAKLRAFGDRLFSRIVGFFARITLIIAGIVALCLQSVVSVIAIILYPLLPILPVVCLLLFFAGVTI